MLENPNAVVTGSVPKARIDVPAMPHKVAAVLASDNDKTPVTNGRCCVRFICESRSTSIIWFHAAADDEHKAVPPTQHVANNACSDNGPPAATNPAAVVVTTKADNFAFANSKYAFAFVFFCGVVVADVAAAGWLLEVADTSVTKLLLSAVVSVSFMMFVPLLSCLRRESLRLECEEKHRRVGV